MRNINYNMKFSVSEVAQILQVEKELVKTWSYKFSENMSSTANPGKGIPRIFELEDLRVMGYILMYWEDDPDIESIKAGLNSNGHYEIDLIDNLISQVTPLFIEPPENIDDTWKHGIIFSGLSEVADMFELAKSYKLAGDRLIDIALENEEGRELFYPAIYNYRHATELYIKSIIGKYNRSHNFLYLFDRLKEKIKTEFDESIPEWFENIIIVFNDFDPEGTSFRYGGDFGMNEMFADFNQLKFSMNRIANSFKNIREHQGLPY
jgi:hypothetical protein